jgi:hypothetical protein
MSNSFRRQVDVVFTKDGIPTLVDVVIANPTRVDFFSNLAQFKDLLPSMQLKPKKEVITTDNPLIHSSL